MDREELIKEIDNATSTMRETKKIVNETLNKVRSVAYSANNEETYNKGLEDAWELAKKIYLPTVEGGITGGEIEKIFDCHYSCVLRMYTPQEALAKLETYEKEKEINVGDVVGSINTGRLGVITKVEENGKYVMFSDGMAGMFAHNDIRKTGKHIDINCVLEQLKEE